MKKYLALSFASLVLVALLLLAFFFPPRLVFTGLNNYGNVKVSFLYGYIVSNDLFFGGNRTLVKQANRDGTLDLDWSFLLLRATSMVKIEKDGKILWEGVVREHSYRTYINLVEKAGAPPSPSTP